MRIDNQREQRAPDHQCVEAKARRAHCSLRSIQAGDNDVANKTKGSGRLVTIALGPAVTHIPQAAERVRSVGNLILARSNGS